MHRTREERLGDDGSAEPLTTGQQSTDPRTVVVPGLFGRAVRARVCANGRAVAIVSTLLIVSAICAAYAGARGRVSAPEQFLQPESGNLISFEERVPGVGGVEDRDMIIFEFGLSQPTLNPTFDWQYPDSDGKKYAKHGVKYTPPWLWMRLAMTLEDPSIMDWKDGWIPVYHGTSARWVPNILKHGLLIKGGSTNAAHGEVYGTGVYVTEFAEYAKEYTEATCVDGKTMVAVMGCRVRPGSWTKTSKYYIWVIHDKADILCTSVLFKVVGVCKQQIRKTTEDCSTMSEHDCCDYQDTMLNRCLVVADVTAPSSALRQSCASADVAAGKDFRAEIHACPVLGEK
mmetsp:Transcript_23379/g.66139  ORF Transcript_23379/g.66139 Transcript_23379/m.66139 type:complete len:343 (-) Transcript_23379:61-1089(-)